MNLDIRDPTAGFKPSSRECCSYLPCAYLFTSLFMTSTIFFVFRYDTLFFSYYISQEY